MDKREARQILADAMREYRDLPYATLVSRIGEVDAKQATSPTGVEYAIEIEVFWDDSPKRDVRVIGSIDDGRLLTFIKPLCDDFIKSPAGEFVGEGDV